MKSLQVKPRNRFAFFCLSLFFSIAVKTIPHYTILMSRIRSYHLCVIKAVLPFVNGKLVDTGPKAGPLNEIRKKFLCDVASHLFKCRARLKRKKIMKHDEMFARHHPYRFRSHTKKTQKVLVF